MNTRMLTIAGKRRENPIAFVSLNDFEHHDAGATDPRAVLEQPNTSLYCLDHQNKRAIFVVTSPGVNLSEAPFYYQAQYQHAQSVIAVPYETLHELVDDVHVDPERMIFIYSVGRCGSTLVSRAFSQAESVTSFSEPDVYSQILMLHQNGGATRTDVSALIRSCTRVMCAAAVQSEGSTAWALKFRSMGIQLADFFSESFPQAKVVFLYRHIDTWSRSAARAFHFNPAEQQVPSSLQEVFTQINPFVASYTAKGVAISSLELSTCVWLSAMEEAVALQRQGQPMFCARYEELKAAPQELLDAMFRYCGVSASSKNAIEKVLQEDSQSGTSLSRDNAQKSGFELQERHLATVHRLIGELSKNVTPDLVLSGTFRLAGA